MSIRTWLEHRWYSKAPPPWWLRPFAALFRKLAASRRVRQMRWAQKHKAPIPVIVVGNISVGGTGKTPFVIWLVEHLRQWGYRPGVISRGYHGHAKRYPLRVTEKTDARECGDEPAVLFRRLGCPVVVAPNRVKAVKFLVDLKECDIIVADDGLQHYKLARDVEICVVDGSRGLGNGATLPAGPLREPPERIDEVDLVVVNSGSFRPSNPRFVMMHMATERAVSMSTGESLPLSRWSGQNVHAVAGLGNPDRFFRHLQDMGMHVIPHPFPDHYRFKTKQLQFKDPWSVLITEKDAVKCRGKAQSRLWYVPASAHLGPGATTLVRELLRKKLPPHRPSQPTA